MTCKAGVLIKVPGFITLDDRDDLIEKVRQTAHPMPGSNRELLIEWEADNLWDLRGFVEETVAEVESMEFGIQFPDRDVAQTGGKDDTNLAKFAWWVQP